MKKIITAKSEKFLEQYLNNASPTGFESPGQKLWMDYMRPYTDEFIIEITVRLLRLLTPENPTKWLLKRMPMRFLGLCIISPAMALSICEEMAVPTT